LIAIDILKQLHGSNGTMPLKVTLAIKEGDFVALTGASGSGKTTLLRILAGLEEAKGTLRVNNELWLEKNFSLPPQKRKIGFVFQDYALFENMTVEENLLYAKNDKQLAKYLLELTELLPLAKRFPKRLSGGQKQRVSLCRAFMNRPKLLLMDEPLSALDPTIRAKLQDEILKLHKEFGTTTIMVSHDPSEIYKLSNRVILLENGRVSDYTTPQELYLNRRDSTKLHFQGEILHLLPTNSPSIAVVSVGQQIIKIAIAKQEAHALKIGDRVQLECNSSSITFQHS